MSKHRHHRKSHFGQYVLTFLLFLMISVLSLSLCASAFITNPNTFAGIFTSEEYITGLHNDIVTYAKDECKKASVPDTFVESTISYDLVYEMEASYIKKALNTSDAYSKDAFESNVESLQDKLKDAVEKELKAQGMKSSVKDGSTKFAQSITDYASKKAQFRYIDKLQAVLNVSKVLNIVMSVASGILAVFLLIFVFLGRSKRYRSLRNICYAFESAALFDFVMVGAVGVVKATKDLVIYPTYLCSAIMSYVNKSMLTVFTAGLILVFISIIITVVIWRIKRGNE